MELALKKEQYEFYLPMALEPFYCETMRESIVPDSCADIARIVDTSAIVYLNGREVTGDNRFSVSGTVDVTVLYIPEKGSGPCTLRYQLPFQCYGDGRDGESCHFPEVCGEIQSVDTRLLNPRKVLTRVNLILYPAGCRKVTLSLCTQHQETDSSIQLLQCSKETRVISCVREKDFTFIEEVPLSSGRGGVSEILMTKLDVIGTDSKLIGNKMVVKGLVAARILYKDDSGAVALLQQELPFSQIMDGAGIEENWESEPSYHVLGIDCRTGNSDGSAETRMITLTVQLHTRVILWRRETVTFLCDLYSITQTLNCRMREVELWEDSQRQSRRISGREMLETGVAVKSVVDTSLEYSPLRLSADGENLEVTVRAKCLYWDENDMLRCVSKDFSIICPAEIQGNMTMEGASVLRGDMITNIMPEGIEIRFPMDCILHLSRCTRYLCVDSVEIVENDGKRDRVPSVVLRKMGDNESLWSVAKQYRTTCSAIMEVNEITDERHIPTDKMLLIPRARA